MLGGVGSSNITIWRRLYESGGIKNLLYDKRTAGNSGRPSLISKEEHKKLQAKLNDPTFIIKTIAALWKWYCWEFGKTINYCTFVSYCRTNFGTKFITLHKRGGKNDENAPTKKSEARKGKGTNGRRHEGAKARKSPVKKRKSIPENRLDAIMDSIVDNARISMLELSRQLDVNQKTIKRDIQKLKEEGLIERIGPDKGGHWKVCNIRDSASSAE